MSGTNLIIIGISGVTCGGKTTLASNLNQMLPRSKVISQDDYFLEVEDPRHTWIPELNHINFDILSSMDMEKMHADIKALIRNKAVTKDADKKDDDGFQTIPTDVRSYVYEKVVKSDVEILIVEGFSIFNYEPLVPLFSLKYYFTLSKEECLKRRNTRVYEPPDCPGYFEKCVWPEHLKQLEEVRDKVRGVTCFDEFSENVMEEVLLDVTNLLS